MIIYWYTTTKEFNEIKPGETYCIGEVDPSAAKYFGLSTETAAINRIKEELGKVKDGARITFKDITEIEYKLIDFPNSNNKERGMDKDIHKVLESIGCKRIATEWFDTSSNEIKRVIDHIENGTSLGKKWTLRKRQEEAITKFKNVVDRNEKKFGLFAMPRFGKTIISFEMMNYIFQKFPDKKYIFFLSAKLDAKGAVREDYYKFGESCEFKLYMGDDRQPTREELQNNKYLFFASKQFFDGKSLEDIQKKFKSINKDDCAAVFFDEAHFARMTDRAQRTISILNPKMQIDITGTPFRLKSNEDYNDDNSYVYSVLDEAEDFEKAIDKDKFRIDNPELVYITPENEFFKADSTFGNFFEGDLDEVKNQIKKWVKNTFYSGKFNIDGNSVDVQNAIVVVPPRRKYCDLFASAVNEIAKDEKLAIKCVKTSTKDKEEDNYIEDNEKRFREWNEECKKDKANFHLLVTIGKGLQAVSFPDCHAVIMMSDMTSPEAYIQAAFRSKTPNGIKKEAYVIDYNKGRTLQMVDTFIKNHLSVMACDSNYKQEYNRALSTIQIKDHSLTRQNYTFEEIFNTFTSSWNIEKITDAIDFDLDKLANKIDLSNVKLADLQKPHQLQLQLTDRGEGYEEQPKEEPELGPADEELPPEQKSPDIISHIEKLKDDLVKFGYIPFGGEEKDRQKNINRADIEQRKLPVGINEEKINVWSYMGGEETLDDIYIDESGQTTSSIRWKYVENNQFVNISGKESHGDGENNKKKVRAFINAVVRYLPAYFLVSGQPNGFDDFANRFGRRNHAEKFQERQLFCEFMGMGIDYRYVLEILRACDAGSREQIIEFCNDKVKKCFNNSGNILSENVLDLLWIYRKDGSRPVPKDLANKMRNGKNYDIVVCGGYYLTDEFTKMYITDSFSESQIIKKLRPAMKVIYSKNIPETLESEKEEIMKFQSFIMNPPYGNLHLPILKKMVELVIDNGGYGVSLQPVRWVQDTLAKYKQATDYNRYSDLLKGKLNNIEVLSSQECIKVFDAVFAMDLGIYDIVPHGNFDLDTLHRDDLLEKIVDKIVIQNKIHTTISKKMEKEKRLGIRVKINDIQGNGMGEKGGRKDRLGMYRVMLINNGFIDGNDWTECVQKNQCSRNAGSSIPYSIEFATTDEAENFIKSTKTIFWQYLMLKMHKDVHVPNQWLPFMNDYSEPWTDERFYKYFEIPPAEQKVIEKTVEDAKK